MAGLYDIRDAGRDTPDPRAPASTSVNPVITLSDLESGTAPNADKGGIEGEKKSVLPPSLKLKGLAQGRHSASHSPQSPQPQAETSSQQDQEKQTQQLEKRQQPVEAPADGESKAAPAVPARKNTGMEDSTRKPEVRVPATPIPSRKILLTIVGIQSSYRLDAVPDSPREYPSVDIIAVHDLGETAADAWSCETTLASGLLGLKTRETVERHRDVSPDSQDQARRNELGARDEISRKLSKMRKRGLGDHGIRASETSITLKAAGPLIGLHDPGDKGNSSEVLNPLEGKIDAEERNEHPVSPTSNARPVGMEPSQKDSKLKNSRKDAKINSLEGSVRSSSDVDRLEKPRTANWLFDFIPQDILQSRAFTFSYPSPEFEKKPGSWTKYVEDAAKSLLQHIKDSRQHFAQKDVPIVFIGYGFGGVIIQRALELAAKQHKPSNSSGKSDDKSAEREEHDAETGEAGAATQNNNEGKGTAMPDRFPLQDIYQVLFLDTPFPRAEGTDGKDLFPANTNVRMCQILQEIETREKGSGLIEKTWADYVKGFEVAPGSGVAHRGFRTNWLYSQARTKQNDGNHSQPSKVCNGGRHFPLYSVRI